MKKLLLMFVPCMGYFVPKDELVYKRGWMSNVVEPLWWKVVCALENTLAYFLLGLVSWFVVPFESFVIWSLAIWSIAGTLEYLLMRRKPHWFSWYHHKNPHDRKITKFEFAFSAYHAFWSLMAGRLVLTL